MTYYNGNPYHGPTESAPLDAWAHDACLPEDQFTVTILRDWRTGEVTEHHKQQNWPWHWDRIYGAAKPCAYCGGVTERQTERGTWEATAPLVLARAS